MHLRYRLTGKAPVGPILDDMRRPVQLIFAHEGADQYVRGLNGWAPPFAPIVSAAEADEIAEGEVVEFELRPVARARAGEVGDVLATG